MNYCTMSKIELANLLDERMNFSGVFSWSHEESLKINSKKRMVEVARRLDNIERIATLRRVIALGRGAVRLFRAHYNKYVNNFDQFCVDYDYKTIIA